ncbi:hypothetical protein SK128_008763, partial [Halocaridina rubra]
MRQSIVWSALWNTVPERCHYLLKLNIPVPIIVRLLSNWLESHPGHGLLEEEIEQERLLNVTVFPVAAMANARGPRSRAAESERCTNCHSLGHRWEQCEQTGSAGTLCLNCLGSGHWAARCPSKRMSHGSLQ